MKAWPGRKKNNTKFKKIMKMLKEDSTLSTFDIQKKWIDKGANGSI